MTLIKLSYPKTRLKEDFRKMIEHRLYSIEKWEQGEQTENKILLCTPKCATMYVLKGYEVFDFHESLEMEPEQLCEHSHKILSQS